MNSTLSTGLRSALTSVLEHALAKGLIHEDTYSYAVNVHFTEENRTQKFLKALRERVSYDPKAFHHFVEILDGENSLKILAGKMRESLKQVESEEKQQLAMAAEDMMRQDEYVVSKSPYPVKSRPYYVPRNSPSLDVSNHESPLQRRDYYSTNRPAIKPADLPLSAPPVSNQPGQYRNISRTPGNYRKNYFEGNAGPHSEPAVKHNSPSMAFGSVAYSPKREDGPHIASTRSACMVSPMGHGGLGTTLNEVTTGQAMKTFTKTQSELHMTLPPTSQYNVPPQIPRATVDPQESKNLDTLSNRMAQVSMDENESSQKALPGSNMASESTVIVSPPRPDTGNTSPQVNDRNPPSVNSTTTTGESIPSTLRLPKDTVEQQSSQAGPSDKEPSDAQGSVTTKSHNKLTLDEIKKNHMNSAGIEISTTAPTPIDAKPKQSRLSLSEQTDNNSNHGISHDNLHSVDSGTTSGTKESQLLEPGYQEPWVRRNPSLMSSSSIDSDSSTCESAEIDPIQESKQNSDEQSPLVSSGGIMPGACSTNRVMAEKPKRQRCGRCKKLKQDLLVVRAQLNERDHMLNSERQQSTMQVNDLKEQVFRAEQEGEMKLRQYERDFELRHRRAERLILKLQRELQLVEEEKRGLKIAHDSCLQRFEELKADFRRADSLQCPDVEYGDCNYDGIVHEHYEYSNYPGAGGQPPPTYMYNTTYNMQSSGPAPCWQPQHIPQTAHHNNNVMYQQ